MLIANDDLSAPQIFLPRIDHGVVNEGLACHEKNVFLSEGDNFSR